MEKEVYSLLVRGKEHYKNKEYEEAERCLRQVIERKYIFPDVLNILGVICYEKKELKQAKEYLERALQINPNYTEAGLNLAITYNELGEYKKAKEIYNTLISTTKKQKDSMDPFARGKIANMHFKLGQTYIEMGAYKEGIAEYKKALSLCPSFVDIRVRLGCAYRDIGEFECAYKELTKAIQIKPSYIEAQIHLGITLYTMNKKKEAIAIWQEALKKDPTNQRVITYLQLAKKELK
jgi:tetratricopeptide (TPR) repeat protein